MSEVDIHLQLRNTWEETPLLIKVPKDDFKILSQENRISILKALNTGIYESDYKYLRHILTAQEILDYIQKNNNEDFKLTNVYFHLQKLQEKNFIKEVTQIGTGKRPKTFYGRTAKIFINTATAIEDLEEDLFFLNLFKIVKKINPALTEEQIKEPFIKINSLKWDEEAKLLEEWFHENKEILEEVDIDFTKLYNYLSMILDYNPETIGLTHKLGDLFSLRNNLKFF